MPRFCAQSGFAARMLFLSRGKAAGCGEMRFYSGFLCRSCAVRAVYSEYYRCSCAAMAFLFCLLGLCHACLFDASVKKKRFASKKGRRRPAGSSRIYLLPRKVRNDCASVPVTHPADNRTAIESHACGIRGEKLSVSAFMCGRFTVRAVVLFRAIAAAHLPRGRFILSIIGAHVL